MIPQLHAEQAPASATFTQSGVSQRRTEPQAQDSEALTAEQREEAITRAGELMERRYKAFDDTGCLAALGDAHAALLLMKKLIAGRDRDTVLRMEIKRGLI